MNQRFPFSFRRLLGAAALLFALVAPAWAQAPAPGLPDADKQAIQKYTLNDDVFTRLIDVTKDARTQGIKPDNKKTDFSQVHNLDDLSRQVMSSDARIEPLIKKHGFTPRDFLLANMALTNAAMAAQAKSNPEMAKYIDQSKVNAANVAFFESHQQQIMQLMQEAGDQKK
jgi:hypothetical protein